MQDDGPDSIDEREIQDASLSLITAILHDDTEAMDFVLMGLNLWQTRALAVHVAAYVAAQVEACAEFDGGDPIQLWAQSVTRRHGHSSA